MNVISFDLDEKVAVASFASGVKYTITPFLVAYPERVNSPVNAQSIVYSEMHENNIVEIRHYSDMTEASFDEKLPSVAKFLLQGLLGVTL